MLVHNFFSKTKQKHCIVASAVFLLLPLLAACQSKQIAQVEHRYKAPSLQKSRITQENPYKITVKPGDTLYKIARSKNVELRKLIDLNRLSPPYTLTPGEKLRLPKATFHLVNSGDSLYSIARTYGVDISQIVRANNISLNTQLKTGQRLRLPSSSFFKSEEDTMMLVTTNKEKNNNSSEPVSTALSHKIPTPKFRPGLTPVQAQTLKPIRNAGIPQPIMKTQNVALKTQPSRSIKPRYSASSRRFNWPVKGTVVSRFGPKKGGLYNDGINISAKKGTPVRAADNGKVVYSGNELRGYGNLLLVKHNDGWLTAYAHTSDLKVKKGDNVQKGQVIASVGSTGHVDQPQLHFSIRKGRKALNPEKYL